MTANNVWKAHIAEPGHTCTDECVKEILSVWAQQESDHLDLRRLFDLMEPGHFVLQVLANQKISANRASEIIRNLMAGLPLPGELPLIVDTVLVPDLNWDEKLPPELNDL